MLGRSFGWLLLRIVDPKVTADTPLDWNNQAQDCQAGRVGDVPLPVRTSTLGPATASHPRPE